MGRAAIRRLGIRRVEVAKARAPLRRRITGRTDGSIRPSTQDLFKLDLVLKGAFSNRAPPVKPSATAAPPGSWLFAVDVSRRNIWSGPRHRSGLNAHPRVGARMPHDG